MIPAERQNYILTCLAERDVVSITELTERLGASHMTVRRDIRALEHGGHVTSVTGGVKLSRRLERELPHLQKARMYSREKQALGREATTLIRDEMVIYLDAGTTMLEIARHLSGRKNLTVVTNDFVICAYLSAHSDFTIYHSGGLVERSNQSCVGAAASDALRRFNYDIAFISTSSWTLSGLSSPSEAKSAVKQIVTKQARQSVLVSDSSKYGMTAAVNILPLDVFDALITDQQIAPDAVMELESFGLKAILVDCVTDEGIKGDKP